METITDFSFADDVMQIDDAVFGAFSGRLGAITTGEFRANASGLAQDANDFIVYETDTGELYYDSDGNGAGAGILFAKVGIGLGLTNADVVAI